MMKASILLSIVLLLALIGCRQATDEATSPTPAPTFGARAILAEAVSPVTLLRNPSAFEDSFLRVAGSYKPLPILVCGGDTHLSPATWALTSGDGQINSAGFDRALRDLASEGLPLVVDGRWRRWEGPVGCGRRAPIEQIWYLDVLRIVSPNPLTLADASGEQDEIAQALPTGSPDATGDQLLNTPGSGSGSTPLFRRQLRWSR